MAADRCIYGCRILCFAYECFNNVFDFINLNYLQKDIGFLMDIDLRPYQFVFWTAMYNKFDTGIQPREYVSDVTLATKLHIDCLKKILDEKNQKKVYFLIKTYKIQLHFELPIKWQSLLNCNECSSSNCQLEFVSRFERRNHCILCGKIFCQRCFSTKTIEIDGKICINCSTKL